jgi:hypothetical protein
MQKQLNDDLVRGNSNRPHQGLRMNRELRRRNYGASLPIKQICISVSVLALSANCGNKSRKTYSLSSKKAYSRQLPSWVT